MRTTEGQRENTNRGNRHEGTVYVWDGSDLDPVHDTTGCEPFATLADAQAYVDGLDA